MDKEFGYNQQLRDISEELYSKERLGPEKLQSLDRITQANNEQSRLINQRQNTLPPQRFESNEDI